MISNRRDFIAFKKGNQINVGRIPHNKGRTNIELYGEEKAVELARKNGEAHKGKNLNESVTKKRLFKEGKLVAWNKGLTINDLRVKKYSEKHSESMKGRQPSNYGKKGLATPGSFQKGHVPANKGKSWSETIRRNMSISKKNMFALHPEARQRMRKIRLNQSSMPKENSSLNKKVAQQLAAAGIHFEPEEKLLGITKADFLIQPNIVIFCDGDYWHSFPNVKERDARITRTLDDNGYIVIRLSEHNIKRREFDVMKYINPLLRKQLHS